MEALGYNFILSNKERSGVKLKTCLERLLRDKLHVEK